MCVRRACSDTWVGFQKTPIERRLISSLWISRVVVVAPIQSIRVSAVNKICRIVSIRVVSNISNTSRWIKRGGGDGEWSGICVPLQPASGLWMDIKVLGVGRGWRRRGQNFLYGRNYNIGRDTVLLVEIPGNLEKLFAARARVLIADRSREEIRCLVRYFLISSSD